MSLHGLAWDRIRWDWAGIGLGGQGGMGWDASLVARHSVRPRSGPPEVASQPSAVVVERLEHMTMSEAGPRRVLPGKC